MDSLRTLQLISLHRINLGYNTVAVDDLHKFLEGVKEAGWTEEKLEDELTKFYQLVNEHKLHDIGPDNNYLGLDPLMIHLVDAYEQARTNV